MNKWIGIGRSTKDVEVRYTSSGEPMAVAKVTMAIDSGYGDKKKTNFVPITCFGKTAEVLERYLRKGKLFAVEGEYSTGSYENKEGKKVYTTEIIASKVEIIEWPDKDESNIPEGFTQVENDGAFAALDDSEVPF